MKLDMLMMIPALFWLAWQNGLAKDDELIPKPLATVLLSVCVAALAIPPGLWLTWQTLVVIAGTAIVYNVSYGEPMGKAISGATNGLTELWQVGPLAGNCWLALAVRGSFHAIPGLLIGEPLTAIKLGLAFGIAFPFAPWLATRVFKRHGDPAWGLNNGLRGGLVGALLVASAIAGMP